MNILITGANGFIGKNLVTKLREYKDLTIFEANRQTFDLKESSKLIDYINLNKIDIIINTAVSLTDLNDNLSVLYTMIKASSAVSKIILLGSGIEYNPKRYKPLMDEEYFSLLDPPNDNNIYHNAKYITSAILKTGQFKNIYNFRLFGVFGRFEDYTRRLISNNIYTYLKDGKLKFNKDIAFDYLDVEDLAPAIYKFINNSNQPNHNEYNICTGKPLKFSHIIETIRKYYGADPSCVTIVDDTKSDYEYSGSPKRFEEEFDHQILQTSLISSIETLDIWLKQEIIAN